MSDLWVRYPGTDWVLRGVDLTAEESEVHVLLGPCGSGKTTLLRVLCGVIPHVVPAEVRGTAQVLGTDVVRTPLEEVAQHVVYVPEEVPAGVVLPVVYDELRLTLLLAGKDLRILEQVCATEILQRPVDELSYGELLRILLTKVFLEERPVVLLDEPSTALDPSSRCELVRFLDELAHRYGATVLVTEHDLDYLLPVADKVTVLESGRITWSGDLETFLSDVARQLRCLSPLVKVFSSRRYG